MGRLATFALIGALAAGPVLATQNAIPGRYDVFGVSADDVLNIRSGPSASAGIVGTLAPDATGIVALALSEDGRWVRVQEGWVSGNFLAPQPGEWAGRWPEPLACTGTEPFWALEIRDSTLILQRLGDTPERFTATPPRPAEGRRDRWSVGSGDGSLSVVLGSGICSDGMSEELYPFRVDIVGPDAHLTGCCTLMPD